jgi:hypothetical protein
LPASRKSELFAICPLTTVSGWIGNLPEVAAKHYILDRGADANFQNTAGKGSAACRMGKLEVVSGSKENAQSHESQEKMRLSRLP